MIEDFKSPQRMLLAFRRLGHVLSLGGRFHAPKSVLRRIFKGMRTSVTIPDFDGSLTMSLHLGDHMQRRIFWMGFYSDRVVSILDEILSPGMVVLDAGANIGEVSLFAGKRVGSNGRVLAFEPIERIAKQLEEHIAKNSMSQVTVVKKALGENNAKEVPIYASCGQPIDEEHCGLGSLFGTSENGPPVQLIEVVTLDSWLAHHPLHRLDLVKVDIEGAELAFLRGAEGSLRRFKPLLIMEIQAFSAQRAGLDPREIFDYLGELGYRTHCIGPKGTLSPIDATSMTPFQDVLCVPSPYG